MSSNLRSAIVDTVTANDDAAVLNPIQLNEIVGRKEIE